MREMMILGACLACACAGGSEVRKKGQEPKVELLWPDGAPGATGDKQRDKPTLTIHLAPAKEANGAAVVVCPGGGYGFVSMDNEGKNVAAWLNSIGVHAFIVRYRISPYRHPVPMNDAKRAVRIVRSRAKEWGVDPKRIGIIGFSAGGHLASTVGTHFDSGDPKAEDPVERAGCRPDFMILVYPVISMSKPFTHDGSRRNLLGDMQGDAKLRKLLSSEEQVAKETPPTFLVHTGDDKTVPVENSVAFYEACRKAGVPAEMHIYEKGPHGFGMGNGDAVLESWPGRCEDWMRLHGVFGR